MEQQPLVSVIINCYNGEKYLREAIDSVIAQTYTNWEIIFWDNQSTDSTAEIVKSYKDDRIRYYYAPEHTPLGEARNLAMKKADGKYISFLDADDIWNENIILKFVDKLESDSDLCLVFCRFNVMNNSFIRRNRLLISDCDGYITAEDFISGYSLGMSGAAIRKQVLNCNGIRFNEDFSLIEDYDFFIRTANLGKIYYISTPYFTYREHGDNLSHKASTWCKELKNLKFLILSEKATYKHLKKSIKCIDDKIWAYDFHDAITNKQYIRALFKHPRAFFYWTKSLLLITKSKE